jgi:flagellar basal-body rod modification protein FlgD
MVYIPPQMTIGSVRDYAPSEETRMNSDLDMEQFLYIIANAMSMPSFDGASGGGGGETDYIGQMVQFGVLNQMQELNNTMQATVLMSQQQQAMGLVGKEVTLATQEASLITGTVEKVRFTHGYATIVVDGKEYNMNDVLEVGVGSND